MAHLRRPLAIATALNTGVLVLEAACGVGSGSLGLIADAAHNLSDEVALACLLLAYCVATGLSGRFLRIANLLNSVGIFVIAVGLVWEGAHRILHPTAIPGAVVVAASLLSAVGNFGVARVLRHASTEDASIRLAYVHNMGDALVSLGPALGGAFVLVLGVTVVDSAVALVIAAVLILSTLQFIRETSSRLPWPERVVCGPVARAAGAQ